jgi:Nucleotide modification associated domain 3
MKIILSRKGFDSSTGKRPSFITQKGELVSLPIPDSLNSLHKTTYASITTPLGSLGTIVPAIKARTKGKLLQYLQGNEPAHLDPDLLITSIPRPVGRWVMLQMPCSASMNSGRAIQIQPSSDLSKSTKTEHQTKSPGCRPSGCRWRIS